MYYTYPQRSTAAQSRLHTSTPNYRIITVRFIALLMIMLVIISIGAIVQANAGGPNSGSLTVLSAGPAQSIPTVPKVVVEQGDSLWTIASFHAPKGADVRVYLDQIKKINQLKSSALREGQVLLLP